MPRWQAGTPGSLTAAAEASSQESAGAKAESARDAKAAAKEGVLACPTSGSTLERYAGGAAHKIGTAFCRKCGLRHRLYAR